MTDRERKDYYLGRIRRTATRYKFIPTMMISRLEEELKIIMWNNDEDWTEQFMNDEVVPLLSKYGVKVNLPKRKEEETETIIRSLKNSLEVARDLHDKKAEAAIRELIKKAEKELR